MSINHIIRSEINLGERRAPVIARINRRAKQLILKVDPVAGEIHVTAPSKRALPEALAFAQDRAGWIENQLDDELRAKPFVEGCRFPFRGEPHVLVRRGGPRAPVRIEQEPAPSIIIGGEAAHTNRRVTDWLKRQARADLTERVDHFSALIGKKRTALRIRDTRSRWGSCSSDGVISFSWRLIMAPPAILNYVAAHECVHLVHLNHSHAYWRMLKSLGVDVRAADHWLRTEGPRLFSFGVAPTTSME